MTARHQFDKGSMFLLEGHRGLIGKPNDYEIPAVRVLKTFTRNETVTKFLEENVSVMISSKIETPFPLHVMVDKVDHTEAYRDWLVKNGYIERFTKTHEELIRELGSSQVMVDYKREFINSWTVHPEKKK